MIARIRKHLFAKDLSELRGVSGWCLRWARVFFLAGGEFHRDFCFERAATLAFATVISLIPLAVLFFSFGVQFGVGDRLMEYAREKLIPLTAPDFREDLVRWLENHISKDAFAQGLVGLVGLSALIGLLLSALAIFVTAERNFNRIWKVKGTRTYMQKLTIFWVVLTTSPFLLTASAAVGNLLVPADSMLERLISGSFALQAVYTFCVPVSIGLAGFTVLYYFLPSAQVRMRSAALGGLVAAVLWVACKESFYLYVARTSSVYGSLAVFPLFLFFIYLNWAIVLWGSEIAYVHQHLPWLCERVSGALAEAALPPAFVAVSLLEQVGRRFRAGMACPSANDVARTLAASPAAVLEVALVLVERGVLAEDAHRPGAFLLARAPERVDLGEVVQWFPGEAARLSGLTGGVEAPRTEPPGSAPPAASSAATEVFRRAESLYRSAFASSTLADLLSAGGDVRSLSASAPQTT
jgi:membrane protein